MLADSVLGLSYIFICFLFVSDCNICVIISWWKGILKSASVLLEAAAVLCRACCCSGSWLLWLWQLWAHSYYGAWLGCTVCSTAPVSVGGIFYFPSSLSRSPQSRCFGGLLFSLSSPQGCSLVGFVTNTDSLTKQPATPLLAANDKSAGFYWSEILLSLLGVCLLAWLPHNSVHSSHLQSREL